MRIIIIQQQFGKPLKNSELAEKNRPRMDDTGMTLDALKRGQKGIITAVDATDPQVQRLMVLGLVEGAEVELAGAALGGDPMEFRLFGSGISLRQEQARSFSFSSQETVE